MGKIYKYNLKTETGGYLGKVVLTEEGEFFSITDWGNFNYSWGGFGDDFRKFILTLEPGYFASKMSEGMSYTCGSRSISKAADRFASHILEPLKEKIREELKKEEPQEIPESKQRIMSVYSYTNQAGRVYLKKWEVSDPEILGVEYDDNPDSDWFYVIKNNKNKTVIALPLTGSSCEPSVLGDLRSYVKDKAIRRIGYGKAHTDEAFREICKLEKDYITRYGLDPKFFD